MILGGDLGGTKTLLALAEADAGAPGQLRIVREARFDSRAWPRFEDMLAAFLAEHLAGGEKVEAAAFGLAGPTDGRTAKLTWLPWRLDATALEAAHGIRRVALANDFAAAAHGLELVQPAQLLALQAGQPVERAPRVILGAGTGMGVAGLLWHDGRYQVIPGEGGHMGFAPIDARQAELWRWLVERHGRATVEDVVSGPGLARIYEFVTGQTKAPAEIGEAAVAASDPAAVETLNLWLAAYGAFAGDLGMQWLAYGGVFLAGGVGAKLIPRTSPAAFLDALRAKREHRHIAEALPVHLVTEERLGLLGALALARRLI